MKFGIVTSFVASASMAVTPALVVAQDKAQVFTPVGQWTVDYGDDYCRLARNFSSGSDTLALAFERIAPGPMARMILISNAIKPFPRRARDRLALSPLRSPADDFDVYTHAPTAGGPEYFNLGQFDACPLSAGKPAAPPLYDRAKEQAAGKAITGFVLESGVATPVEVDTGDLSAPIAALQKCADDLAGTWGLDSAKLATEKSPAVPDGGGVGWLPQGTIAFTDFGKLTGGSNQVRVMVDATGKPTSCAIHWATLDATTNNKICKALMAKANFTPAKDANGQPMAGYWIGDPLFMGSPTSATTRTAAAWQTPAAAS